MQTFDQGILIIISSSIFVVVLIIAFLLFLNAYIKRNAAHNMEKLQLRAQFDQTLLQSQLEIKEQTLNHIADELHDNLGQIASLIKINLLTLELDDTLKHQQKLEDTRELVRQLITDLKMLSLSLNSQRVAQLGISKGLESEVIKINRTGKITCNLSIEGSNLLLEDNVTIILFRMSQEIINNILKHSHAERLDITIKFTSDLLILAFTDNGIGFNLEEKLRAGGSGLLNLNNRARLIGANLTIESKTNCGTSVVIELPV